MVFSLGLVSVNQHGGSGACDEHPELVAVWPDVAGSAARRPMDLRSGLARGRGSGPAARGETGIFERFGG